MRYLTKHNGVWCYARKVPVEFATIDARKVIRLSTGISVVNDPHGHAAVVHIARLNEATEAYWRGRLGTNSPETKERYQAVCKRARSLDLRYIPASEIVEHSLIEILERIEKLVTERLLDDPRAVVAALGGIEVPKLMVSNLFTEFEKIAATSLVGMSKDQRRKWRDPKIRAQKNLLEVVPDMPLTELKRTHAIEFQEWWANRVTDEGIDVGTANKGIHHVHRMMSAIDRKHRLNVSNVFADLRLEGDIEKQRSAFTPEFVQTRFLAPGVFDNLNEEARRVVFVIVETGLRLSEAANLTENTIKLDAPVPHILVRPEGRKLKTDTSWREIPLVGVALMALMAQPHGFPRYRDKAASLSQLVNGYLGVRKLRPTQKHSLYSLRHTFEDRLTAVDAPDKMIAVLMGHKHARPKYGSGPTLEHKREWLERIAFIPPRVV